MIGVNHSVTRHIVVGAAVLVAALLFGACAVSNADSPTATTIETTSPARNFVDVPLSHAAIQILAGGHTSYATFSGEARRRDLKDYICAKSLDWELCLVWSDGVLAVVPFGQHAGVVEVHTLDLDGPAKVPLDVGHPVGLASSESPATAVISDPHGNEIGRTGLRGGVLPNH